MDASNVRVVLIGIIIITLALIVVGQYVFAVAGLTSLTALLVPSPVGQNASSTIE